jgi:hypothetical protein
VSYSVVSIFNDLRLFPSVSKSSSRHDYDTIDLASVPRTADAAAFP